MGDGGVMSLRALAKVLGVSHTTIWREQQRLEPVSEDGMVTVRGVMGMDGKMRLSRRIDTRSRDAEIRKLRAAGASMRQIAEAVGCSVGTVHRVLKLRNS